MNQDRLTTFSQYLAERRAEKGWTLRRAAAKILTEDGEAISFQYLSGLENGRRNPPSDFIIEQIAKVYEIPAAILYIKARRIPKTLNTEDEKKAERGWSALLKELGLPETSPLLMSEEALRPNLEALETIYRLPNPTEVIDFLASKPELLEVLMEISGKVREYYGCETVMTLEMENTPDGEDFDGLIVRIHTALNAVDAYAIQERFDREWWLEASGRTEDLVNIVHKFV